MTKLTAEDLKNLASGSKVKVVWLLRSEKEYRGVIHGDKINWDDCSHNEICEIATAIQKGRCVAYQVSCSEPGKTAVFSRQLM